MQTLADYLKDKKKADFAQKMGWSAAQLSQYLSGYRRPSFNLMCQIEAATDGAVSVGSWAHMPPNVNAPAQDQGDSAA